MAKRPSSSAHRPSTRPHTGPRNAPTFDTNKFENVHQIGGIRLGTLDAGSGSGGGGATGPASRVALFNTGAGLRFVVALDRGGDIVDAAFNQYSLAYLSPNGLLPPNHAYNSGTEWLAGWPGGMVTTCGPQHIGGPREEDGVKTSLHGHYSNLPAGLEAIINPDPHHGSYYMALVLHARDSRMFGPVIDIRRRITCRLGLPEFSITDEVTNRGYQRVPHHWLYHVNFGYPLIDQGTRLVYRGKADQFWDAPRVPDEMPSAARLDALKNVPGPLKEHAGTGERGTILHVSPDRRGLCHVGAINHKLNLALELEYPAACLPRLANWQHFGPGGSYVTGLEPFAGSLFGKAKDPDPAANQYLQPGESRSYGITLRVRSGAEGVGALAKYDGAVRG